MTWLLSNSECLLPMLMRMVNKCRRIVVITILLYTIQKHPNILLKIIYHLDRTEEWLLVFSQYELNLTFKQKHPCNLLYCNHQVTQNSLNNQYLKLYQYDQQGKLQSVVKIRKSFAKRKLTIIINIMAWFENGPQPKFHSPHFLVHHRCHELLDTLQFNLQSSCPWQCRQQNRSVVANFL